MRKKLLKKLLALSLAGIITFSSMPVFNSVAEETQQEEVVTDDYVTAEIIENEESEVELDLNNLSFSDTDYTNTSVVIEYDTVILDENSEKIPHNIISVHAYKEGTATEDYTKLTLSTNGTYTYTVVSNGTYYLEFYDSEEKSVKIKVSINNIDKDPPKVELSAPEEIDNEKTITGTIDETGSGIASVELVSDANAEITLNGNIFTYITTENATYRFMVTDKAGNEVYEDITVKNIDAIAPTISETEVNPNNIATKATITVTASDNQNGSGLADLAYGIGDNVDEVTWKAENTFEVESNGTYTVYVKDKAGNISETSVNVGEIDKVAPIISVVVTDNNIWAKSKLITATVDETGSGINSVVLVSDANAEITLNDNTFTYTATQNGTYIFKVTDKAGNVSEAKEVIIGMIDTTAPIINSIAKNPESETKLTTKVTVTIDAEDAGSGLHETPYSFDGGENWQPENYKELTNNAEIVIVVRDAVGNETEKQTISIDNIDTAEPNLTITATSDGDKYTSGSWSIKDVTLNFSNSTENKGTTTYEYQLNGSADWINVTGSNITVTETGTYKVKAISEAGVESAVQNFVVNIDKEIPKIETEYDDAKQNWTNQSVDFTLNISDDNSGVAELYLVTEDEEKPISLKYIAENVYISLNENIKVNIGEDGSVNIKVNINVNINGTYTFKLIDNAGNDFEKDVVVTKIDTTKPELSTEYDDDNQAWTNEDIEIKLLPEDENSGVDKVEIIAVNGTATIIEKSDDGEYVYLANSSTNYKFRVTDEAGNQTELEVRVTKIDKDNPSVEITQNATGNVWTNLLETISFGIFKNETIKVSIVAYSGGVNSDLGSPIVSIQYIKDNDLADGNFYTQEDLEAMSDWIDITDEKFFEVNDNERFIGYFKVVDKAGNVSYASTNGIIFDNMLDGETIKFGIVIEDEIVADTLTEKDNDNDNDNIVTDSRLYPDNVEVHLTITDPALENGSYIGSGIKSIDYRIYEEIIVGENVQEAPDKEWTSAMVFPSSALVQKSNTSFTVNYDVYNQDFSSSIVYVEVRVTDHAGNEVTKLLKLQFDLIPPVVEVAFYPEFGDEDNTSYFDGTRKATITITERNLNTEEGIKITITKDEETVENFNTSWTQDGDTYTATISFGKDGDFPDDGVYEFDIEVTDMAGTKSDEYVKQRFTIDNTAPVLEVTHSPSQGTVYVDDSDYYNGQKVFEIVVEEKNFDSDRVEFKITQDGVAVENFNTSWEKDDDTYTATVSFGKNGDLKDGDFPDDGVYEFDVIVTDKAGHISDDFDVQKFTIDQTAPKITVSYDNNNALNNTFFVKDRTVTIEIDEPNFDYERFNVTINAKDDKGTPTTIDKDSFTKEDGEYKYTYTFATDADYTMGIIVTDKAGNETTYNEDEFTIDKTAPIISIVYDDIKKTKAIEGYFEKRTATITVEEHNWNLEADNLNNNNFKFNITPSKDDEKYSISDWSNVGVNIYEATIEFTGDANYTFNPNYSDLAGRSDPEINWNNEETPIKFTVDTTDPTGTITIGKWTFMDKFLETISFGLFSKVAVNVEISSTDNLSGVQYIQHFRTPNTDNINEENVRTLFVNEEQIKNQFINYTVNPNEKFVAYAMIVDNAGNELIINSEGVIVDDTNPMIEEVSPEITVTPITQPVNGLYNGDVDVSIKVYDPKMGTNKDVYSGLKEISYKVTSQGLETQEGTIPFTEESLTQDHDFTLTVDADKNNSNEVVIEVTATDNAGNVSTKSETIRIDITKPSIQVSYNNNSQDSQFAGFFKENRTATIVITERNFDPGNTDVIVQNVGGYSVPSATQWVKSNGTGNGDNTTHTATITYSNDGDYKFDISTADLATNPNNPVDYGNSVAPQDFTIDKTLPTIVVNYDNIDALNGNYFKEERTAVVAINEHNFETSRVNIQLQATDNGANSQLPTVSSWSSFGDTHTATITFSEDSYYTFDISYTDKAGNIAADYPIDSFYVDTTAPELSITGVEDMTANKGTVNPTVTYSDTNFNKDAVSIKLVGVVREDVDLFGGYTDTENGQIYQFNNFARTKDNDDIYTLSAIVEDMAGNTTTETITFSVNRFGSTYMYGEQTQSVLNKYLQVPVPIVIYEINPDKLEEIELTMFKDNKSNNLLDNENYEISVSGGNGEWYQYTYTIMSSNFDDDAVYDINIYSKDSAGNVSENSLDTKAMPINFAVDKTAPNVIVSNLESGVTYPVENQNVILTASDNMKLVSLDINLNGESFATWDEELIEEMLKNGEDFLFDISDFSNSAHNMVITAKDASGNIMAVNVDDFYVTTDLWVRFYNNKLLFFGSIIALVLLTAGTAFFIIKHKKKA